MRGASNWNRRRRIRGSANFTLPYNITRRGNQFARLTISFSHCALELLSRRVTPIHIEPADNFLRILLCAVRRVPQGSRGQGGMNGQCVAFIRLRLNSGHLASDGFQFRRDVIQAEGR